MSSSCRAQLLLRAGSLAPLYLNRGALDGPPLPQSAPGSSGHSLGISSDP